MLFLQADQFFNEASSASAAARKLSQHEAALSKRIAQLPRPVMSARGTSSITINLDRRGQADESVQVTADQHCIATTPLGAGLLYWQGVLAMSYSVPWLGDHQHHTCHCYTCSSE